MHDAALQNINPITCRDSGDMNYPYLKRTTKIQRRRHRNRGQRSDDGSILGRRTKRKALPMHAQIIFLFFPQNDTQRSRQTDEFTMPPQQRGGAQHGAIVCKADQASIKQGIQGSDQRQAVMGIKPLLISSPLPGQGMRCTQNRLKIATRDSTFPIPQCEQFVPISALAEPGLAQYFYLR